LVGLSEQLRTAKAIADRLSCSVDHVYVLARTGELPAVRDGHKFLRFRDQDVDRYVQSHLVEGLEEVPA
jgi:excisionase family DNA binding protein